MHRQSGLHCLYTLDVNMISLLFSFFLDEMRVGICIFFRVDYNVLSDRKGERTKLHVEIAILGIPSNGK